MAEYTNITDFSTEGLNLGKDQKVMSYLHGLSDFWVYMFDDASKINTLMEANSVVASDTYNKLLQLTSGISLEDISILTNSQIKLVLISDENNSITSEGVATPTTGRVNGKVETYYIPPDTKLKYARNLANRAFLPTSLLENEADFYIDPDLSQISFAKPLSDFGFPFRILPSGAKQYAIWAVDAKVDDEMIYTYYAKLIGINPTTSTEMFKSFVYGMYYLFVNGPDIDTLRKGLNITLGIPLSRDIETVIEIQKYLNTDQYIVVTDLNSYVIPYGLSPTVEIGDVLQSGDEISTWVEVKDYNKDGEWWINFMIPSNIMPDVPSSVPGTGGSDPISAETTPNRYATKGSYADWLMRNYLKKHTFLVNIKTISFKNIQAFEELSKIINEVKPAHTTPIYVWTLPISEDVLTMVDSLVMQRHLPREEHITEGMYRFTRDSTFPLPRGLPLFIRMSGPSRLDSLLGRDANINGTSRKFRGGNVTGFLSPQKKFSTLSDGDVAWNKTFRTRGHEQFVTRRGKLDFKRDFGSATAGTIRTNPFRAQYPEVRLVYLYTTTLLDLTQKFNSVNATIPNKYIFDLFKPTYVMDSIDDFPINESSQTEFSTVMSANLNYLFKPGYYSRFLSPFFPADSQISYCPDIGDIRPGDYMVFTRIGDGGYGVFWATSNYTVDTLPYIAHTVSDPLTITITGKMTRGMAAHGSPAYMLRSYDDAVSYNTSNAPIYSDAYNTSVPRTRGNQTLVTVKAWN